MHSIARPGFFKEKVLATRQTPEGRATTKQVAVGAPLDGAASFGSYTKAQKDARLRLLVRKASTAYITDALLKQAVDKYSENFRDFNLTGRAELVKYVEARLAKMSLRSGEHWKTTFTRAINEYFKTGNAFILKVRSSIGKDEGQRALYRERPHSIAMLYLIPADALFEARDVNRAFVGWQLDNGAQAEKISLVLPGSETVSNPNYLLQLPPVKFESDQKAQNIFRNGADIVQLAYKKAAGSVWGAGLTLAALEDISFLRAIEQSTSIMIKKFSSPLIHHKITRTAGPLQGGQIDIDNAYRLHRQAAPDGVLITPANHEIQVIGSESHAMRNEGYLRYFLDRCFAGLGVSQSLMGIGSMSMGAAEAANEMLMTKVRYCQNELSRELEFFIINELLWEGGWDPYTNESDRVSIEFVDIDEDREIKLRTHGADLFQKNLITLDEARQIAKIKGPANLKGLHVNIVKKAEQDNDTRGKIAIARAKPETTPTNNRERFRLYIKKYVPQDPSGLEAFFSELSLHFPRKQLTDPLFARIEQLLGDDEAIVELLLQELF